MDSTWVVIVKLQVILMKACLIEAFLILLADVCNACGHTGQSWKGKKTLNLLSVEVPL